MTDQVRSGTTEVGDEPEDEPGRTQYLKSLGPGLVTGASDDDPSGIATFAQAGAQYQFATVWTVFITLPLMMAVQEICDRTALATGQSLGLLARRKFGTRVRTFVGVLLIGLMAANALNLAADLMAVGEGMQLLHAGPAPVWSGAVGVGLIGLLVRTSFTFVARFFKWLCLSLLAYIGVLFATSVSWSSVARASLGLDMHLGKDYWSLIVALLGTSISPYLFFWESGHRIEEMREEGTTDYPVPLRRRSRIAADRRARESRVDVFSGMVLSQVVMFAIIVATGATVGAHGSQQITSAGQAAKALEPIAGGLSTVLFALGFIGSGILSVPVLAASASIGLSGLMGREWGFERSVRQAPFFYGLLIFGAGAGTALSVMLDNPIKLLVISALVNGIAAAPFLVLTMLIAGDGGIMGRYRNGKLASTIGWAAAAIMTAAALFGLTQTLTG